MTTPTTKQTSRRRRDAGFTILELLIAAAIMLLVTGAIFALVDPSHGMYRTQPEASEMQQRARVASDLLSKDLVMAGAGIYLGEASGSLIRYFAPVLPFRMGELYPTEPLQRYFPDRITIAYVPNTPSQTGVRDAMPQESANTKVLHQQNCGDVNGAVKITCPDGSQSDGTLCGFCVGDRAVIFDETGSFDFFSITQLQADNNGGNPGALIQHRRQQLSKHYCAEDDPPMVQCADPGHDPQIAKIETHTYFREGNQLFHYTGDNVPPIVVADNVVALRFDYFGDPAPPTGTGCAAAQGLPTLPSNGASLVELPEAILRDGPFCPDPAHPNSFDADLYRVRKVRVSVRVQAPDELRGSNNPFLFLNPGRSTSAYRAIPDYEVNFEVTPRNLNLTR
jgi:type II secretory pathway pseudopilin PulG